MILLSGDCSRGRAKGFEGVKGGGRCAPAVALSSPGADTNRKQMQMMSSKMKVAVKVGWIDENSLSVDMHLIIAYDTVSNVVESKVHQCQQNSDA